MGIQEMGKGAEDIQPQDVMMTRKAVGPLQTHEAQNRELWKL